jgi:hypothetical protein
MIDLEVFGPSESIQPCGREAHGEMSWLSLSTAGDPTASRGLLAAQLSLMKMVLKDGCSL